ncbi:unnamed protein product [Protopolystoma xenopodis]|uniref:Uncharacterized protein n=1 Tax=Protopolystoma xenopodis TaxID=117903 RepID=A0A3S5AF58_9PLAT|nr:unnamed protein product [Protopolystoma xenopodis]
MTNRGLAVCYSLATAHPETHWRASLFPPGRAQCLYILHAHVRACLASGACPAGLAIQPVSQSANQPTKLAYLAPFLALFHEMPWHFVFARTLSTWRTSAVLSTNQLVLQGRVSGYSAS